MSDFLDTFADILTEQMTTDHYRSACGTLTQSSLRRNGEQGDDPEADPPRHGVDVHPEGDPGHCHDQDGGQVRLDQVEAHRPTHVELGHKAAVVA